MAAQPELTGQKVCPVDLEFESSNEAEAFGVALRELWRRAEAEGLVEGPQARVVETVETTEYP
jgi:hypothetical protein